MNSQSGEITYIPVSASKVHVGAAMYLATVAYPNNLDKRTDFVNACQAWLCVQKYGSRLKKDVVVNPSIRAMSSKRKMFAQFDFALKQLKTKRSIALLICKFKLVNHVPGARANLPDGSLFTIEEYLKYKYPGTTTVRIDEGKTIRDVSDHNANNAHRRIWKESKPVLHLCWALDNYLEDHPKQKTIQALLIEPAWVSQAMKEAERVRTLFFHMNHSIPDNQKWFKQEEMIRLLPED